MKRLIPYALIAVALVAGGAYWLANGSDTTALTIGAAEAQDAAAVDTSMIQDIVIGNPEAKVSIVEYASFTCPHCQHFHETAWRQLKENYIDTGKVNFTYREVYFDRFGLWAAMVARCGGGMRYYGIVDIIYDTQSEWLAGGDPAKIADNLRRIGRSAGMNDSEIDACLNDADRAKAMVAYYQKTATADGVEGTPTFFVNGTKYSNMSYEEFAKILDAELAKG
jgi:protein-disulfide isomerase